MPVLEKRALLACFQPHITLPQLRLIGFDASQNQWTNAGKHVSACGAGAQLRPKPVQDSGPTRPFTSDEKDLLAQHCENSSYTSSQRRVKKPGTQRKHPSDIEDSVAVQNFDKSKTEILLEFNQKAEEEHYRKMSRWSFDKYCPFLYKGPNKETHKYGICLGLRKLQQETTKLIPAFPCCVAQAGEFIDDQIASLMSCSTYHQEELQFQMLTLLQYQRAVFLHRNLN